MLYAKIFRHNLDNKIFQACEDLSARDDELVFLVEESRKIIFELRKNGMSFQKFSIEIYYEKYYLNSIYYNGLNDFLFHNTNAVAKYLTLKN